MALFKVRSQNACVRARGSARERARESMRARKEREIKRERGGGGTCLFFHREAPDGRDWSLLCDA